MKKKKNNNLFDKKADFYTSNNGEYHIRKNRIYICGKNYYGKLYTISSNKYHKENVHIIKDIYPIDQNNRLRFLIVNLKNAKKFGTIEKLPNGKERRIAVIENFTDESEYIYSIGNIKSFHSDLVELNDVKNSFKKDYVKKLILKPNNNIKSEEVKKKDN